jgi:hypothetical protein
MFSTDGVLTLLRVNSGKTSTNIAALLKELKVVTSAAVIFTKEFHITRLNSTALPSTALTMLQK